MKYEQNVVKKRAARAEATPEATSQKIWMKSVEEIAVRAQTTTSVLERILTFPLRPQTH